MAGGRQIDAGSDIHEGFIIAEQFQGFSRAGDASKTSRLRRAWFRR